MNKKLFSYAVILMIGFAIGTISSINAENKTDKKNDMDLVIVQKLDKIMASQDEIKSKMDQIFAKIS